MLTTPASQQASTPWDFSIAPKYQDKVSESVSKRCKWSHEEHQLFLDGLKKFGKKWKMVQQHVKTKTREQVRTHAYAYFSKPQHDSPRGDVLELAGFLSSLSQGVGQGESESAPPLKDTTEVVVSPEG